MVHMAKEIELDILEIDKAEAEARLRTLGARKVATHNFRRVVFRLPSVKGLEKWARVRTDGKVTTLTFKSQKGKGLSNTEEVETQVEDFKSAVMILWRIVGNGIYEENVRHEYRLGGMQVTLDKWPAIGWLMEIEGASEHEVMTLYRKLHIRGRPVGNISESKAYALCGVDRDEIMKAGARKLRALLK